MGTMDAPPSRKHAKGAESVAEQRFPARIVSSHAGGHWFESSSLHQKVPDFARNQELFQLTKRVVLFMLLSGKRTDALCFACSPCR